MPTLEEYLAEVPEPKSQFDSWLDSVPDPKDRPKIEAGPSFMDQIGNVASKVSNVFTAPATLFADEFRIPTQTVVDDNAIPVTQANGSTRYEVAPLGDRVAREGGILGVPLAPTEDVIRDLGLEQIPGETGFPAVARGLGRGAVGVANSLTNPINAAMIPIGLGPENAITRAGATALGEATLPNIQRAAAGGFGAQMLSGVPEQVENLSRAETAGQKAEALVGLTGNLALGGLGVAHAASPRVIAALNSDLPATASALARKDLSKTINETEASIPERVLAPQEQSTQQPIAPLSEQGAEVVSEPAVTPDLAGVTEEIINEPAPIQSESDFVLETQTEAAPEAQTQEVANELPEITADVPLDERKARAQQSVLGAIQIVSRGIDQNQQATGRGDISAATPEQQLGELEKASRSVTEDDLASLQDRRTRTTEHDVYFDPKSDRYVKVLQRGQYGLVPRIDSEGRVNIEKATLPEYLNRLRLTNEVFGTDIQVEGVARRTDELDDAKSTSDIVTSQTNIRPADPDNANPSLDQISEFMRAEGFEPVQGVNKWKRAEDGLLIADAKPDNFILTENGVVPIDLLISQETVAEAAQPTTQNAQEYSQSGRPNVAEQNEGSPREVVVEEQRDAPRQRLPTQEVNEQGRETRVDSEKGSAPIIGKWDGTNYGPKPIIAFRDKTSGEVFISPNDRIHALGLGNLVAEGNTNLVKPTNRESGFLIGNEFIEGSLQNPKDGEKITAAMERAATIENNKTASFDESLASDKTRVRLESIARAKNIPEDSIPDVVQNALVKAKAAEESFNPEKGAFSTWVNTIGRNSANDFLRQEIPKNQRETSLESPIGEEATIADTIAAPESSTPDAAAQEVATTLSESLTPDEQVILQRVVMGRESQTIVGKELGMSRQNVARIQKKALEKLRKQMQEKGFTKEDVDFDSDSEFPNLGPGAANALEFTLTAPRATSTKNAVTNAERAERGELQVLKEARQSNEQTFEMAEDLLEKNPNLGRETVVALNEGRKNQVSEVDEAILLNEKVRLRNERDMEADRASDPYSSEESRLAARERWKDLEEQITQLDQATRRSGTIWGRLGQFRQRLMRDDYTFEAMERKARVSKGRPLSPDESAKIKAQADKISDLEQQLEEVRSRLGEKDRVKASEEATAQLLFEARKEADYDPQVETIADRIVNRLSVAADKARARIRERLANASAGVDPVILYDLSVIGAEKLAKGSVKFSRWAAEMISEFGEVVRPYLQDAWAQSNTLIDEAVEKTAPPDKRVKTRRRIKQDDLAGQREYIGTAIKEALEDGTPLNNLSDLVRKLALNFVRSGVKEREALIDAVHGVISEVAPISRETTMDLISGYGDYRLLDKEPAKQTLRQLKGEMQQLAKISDMQSGSAPKKTGVERRDPSAQERALIRQVNELKKRGGFVITDPETQLRTALESNKTRLRNEIIDFDKAIADNIPLVKKTGGIEPDVELNALRAARDAKKAEYDALFPKEPLTETELLGRMADNLDRSITQLEKDIKSGKLYPESKKRMTSPEIEAKKAKLAALREERQTLRDLDTAVVEEKVQAKLRQSIEKAIADEPVRTGRDTVDTKEVADLKAQLAEIRQKRADEKRQDPSFVEAQKEASLLRRIEEAQSESRKTKETPYTVDTERVAKLKRELAEIREAQAASPEAQQKKVDAAIKTTEESILALDKKLQDGDIAPKGPKEPRVTSPELESLRAQRKAMTDLLSELRTAAKPKKTREEISLQAYKSRVATRIAELQDKIAKGDFAKKERVPIKLDKEGQDLSYKLLKQKEDFAKELFKFELQNRSLPKKVIDEAVHVSNTLKAIVTSIDLSAIGKQAGFMTLAHPGRAARAIPDMFRALVSDKERHRINSELWNRPNAELYQRSKLAITDPNSVDLNKLEEAFMSRMLDRLETIPGEPVKNAVRRFRNLAFAGVRASERSYTTFLNVLRADSFDAMAKAISKDGKLTKDEADAIASFVNVATGRGNFWGASQHGATLNSVLWSPRLQASRIELLSLMPLWKKSSPRVKYNILNDYLRFSIGVAVAYNLAMAAGFNIELDPRSSDFGKIRAGNTRVDILAGLGQYITLLGRLISGENKSGKGKIAPIRETTRPLNLFRDASDPMVRAKVPFVQDNGAEILSRFARTKVNPLLGAGINLAAGEDAVGNKVGLTDAAKSLITPLSLSNVTEPFEKEGIPKGSLITLLNILGFSASTYGEAPKPAAK